MQDKLERFFNAINFDIDKYNYFDNASVKEVLLNKKSNKMTLVIENDCVLPLEVFKNLYDKSLTFKGAETVRFKFEVNDNSKYFVDYFYYYFDILVSKCPMLSCINKDNITIEDSSINIEVLNKAEKDKIESLEEKIIKFMENMGYISELMLQGDERLKNQLLKRLIKLLEVLK